VKTLSILGGRVIDPASRLDLVTDVHIAAGKILALGTAPADFTAQREIQAHGAIVCPGLVDLSARLREPGHEHKASISSETRAAACNGITTVCCPPDTDPVVDTPAVAELLQQRAKASNQCRILPLAALTKGLEGNHLAEMADLREAGCVGVSNALHPVINTQVLRNAYDYAASYDLTVFVQPRDPWLGRAGCAHEGAVSMRLGLTGIPEAAETIALARELLLIEQTGVRAHICRLSCARSVELVHEAQQRGLPVTADVSAHQLFLTDLDIAHYNSQCHVYPPLRSQRDQTALRQALADGVISALCSDHQPHEPDAKLNPFAETAAGMSTLDTLLPLGLRLVEEGVLSLPTLIARLTWQPATILGSQAGRLSVGSLADICLIDPTVPWRLEAAQMHSQRQNTPFLGWPFQGCVTHTLLAGKLVFKRESA